MSILLLTCLCGYGVLCSVMWLRRQWRSHLTQESLPRASSPTTKSSHLAGSLCDLLACSYRRRVSLIDSARAIAMVLIVDPDATFGVVRDARYRVALTQAWSDARAWLRVWDSLGADERRRMEALGYSSEYFHGQCTALRQTMRRCVRAPAFEPFPVPEVAAVQGLVESLARNIEGLERALAKTRSEDGSRV